MCAPSQRRRPTPSAEHHSPGGVQGSPICCTEPSQTASPLEEVHPLGPRQFREKESLPSFPHSRVFLPSLSQAGLVMKLRSHSSPSLAIEVSQSLTFAPGSVLSE